MFVTVDVDSNSNTHEYSVRVVKYPSNEQKYPRVLNVKASNMEFIILLLCHFLVFLLLVFKIYPESSDNLSISIRRLRNYGSLQCITQSYIFCAFS